MALIREIPPPEPITFRDDEERDVWTHAAVTFAAAAWGNTVSKFCVTAAEMADSVIRERRSREVQRVADVPAIVSTLRHAADLIVDDRGDTPTAHELREIADEIEAAWRVA